MAVDVDAVRSGDGFVDRPVVGVGCMACEHQLAGGPEGDEVGGSVG